MITSLLTIAGGLFLLHEVAKLAVYGYKRFVKAAKSPVSYGEWAVVTGATDGIGKALSFQLAKRGCNLILISRTMSKLEAVAKEIAASTGVKVEVVQVDYGKFSVEDEKFEEVREALKKHEGELGILINNVGMSYEFPMYFDELSDQASMDLIQLNVTATTLMTKLFLPFVLQKKNGCVVNIGSFAGIFPSPLLAEYSAAKQYIETLTKSLSIEYSSKGVDFQCHVPLYIVSKMSKFKKSSLMVPSADDYAKSVLGNLGKGVIISGHLVQSIVTEVLKVLPRRVMLGQIKKMHLGIRAKGLRKRERMKNE